MRTLVIRFVLMIGCAIAVMALVPLSAQAEQTEWEAGRIPDFVTSAYSGWTYVSTEKASVTSWKWTPAGWERNAWTAGKPVWAYPFGGVWHWAWTGGAWYAIHSSNIAVWSCAAMGAPGNRVMTLSVPMFKWNTATSPVLGYTHSKLGEGPLCENAIPDAAVGHTVYAALPPCAPGVEVACAAIPSPFMYAKMTVDPCVGTAGRIAGCVTALRVASGYIRLHDIWDYL